VMMAIVFTRKEIATTEILVPPTIVITYLVVFMKLLPDVYQQIVLF
jgi:hypothetical protein